MLDFGGRYSCSSVPVKAEVARRYAVSVSRGASPV
ncbi:MAG: hypothetical protein UU11_C0001G0093 [Parcubacteria group bacterium GW2011_GWF2_40_69]|nr:MAG: hypothetical protein UT25_C0002G0007 [Parcubacteria group bacterium GW2011_GWC1_39_12]KKR19494.1 MAG: hypothetical protein UT49_C0002G0340 [Parcubacteria group bacterium GW2011_GWF1_39_37]KKR35120.1 MAG: hypothetical protein UT68_C0005G0069 [Parcubacteria group bacterium GW2011_GWC2_40_10]KKR52443.1 MAG: hypothetical protein UT89_C0002G0244 [Parcubacteria group bacterium GW2011_GWE1_40_20]KKR65902.1 MAG: hypothetical protein UU06_C0009G0019 [Parcubacteria group bacterium GW2011_GWB1_40_